MKRILLLIVIILLHYTIINAQWSNDPTLNTPVCLALGDQINPLIISDGKNGAIICWMNSTNSQIYVQRLDSLGYKMWDTSGVRVSPLVSYNYNHKIISDQNGGIIIVWNSDNNGNLDIYAQRIDPLGNLLWDTLGVEICVKPLSQIDPIIASDGLGGAFIVWEDRLSGIGVCGIYAQQINSNGEALWAANGIPICTSTFQDPIQFRPKIATDSNGGIIVVWDDTRNINKQIYGQKVDSDGNRQWPVTGLQISQGIGEDRLQGIFNTGQNEFIIAWTNSPSTFTETNLYTQKIDSSGIKKWNSSGIPICVSAGNQYYCDMISDNNSGAILVWEDRRTGKADIYAQKIDSIGVIKWQVNGIPICNKTGFQMQARIITDGNDGAIVCWQEMENNNSNIYAQRVDKNGLLKWVTDGTPISISTTAHIEMIDNNPSGAIISWDDRRNGDNNHDIFAQRVDQNGNLGITSIDDKINSVITYSLSQNYPNPFNPSTSINYSIPEAGNVEMKVYDILGNEVATLVNEAKAPGNYAATFDASSFASGIYIYTLRTNNFVQTKKMILMK